MRKLPMLADPVTMVLTPFALPKPVTMVLTPFAPPKHPELTRG